MRTTFKYSLLALACAGLHAPAAHADSWSFDPSMLNGGGRSADIAIFEQGGQLPGIYLVDILLNGERVDNREMVFHQAKDADGRPELKTCLTRAQLTRYGVRVEAFPQLFPADAGEVGSDAAQCARLSAIPQAKEIFAFNSQRLLLSIPQVALRPKPQGIAPQELWDDGIPAFLLNYRANAARSEYRGYGNAASEALYAQLEPGVNLGPWRLRNLTTWQKQGRAEGKWQTAWTYAERGLYQQKSRLTLGDRYTSSEVFDSVPFRGVMLASDDLMVPFNQREFAPVVRGIARSQARIEVRQNGYIIYTTTVAPGAFALTDLPLSGSGGDLQIRVTEADGSAQLFTVPATTPAIALREGYLKYGLMAGRYRPADAGAKESGVAQATVMYGLPWGLTAYGGLQGAENYQAATLGLGASLGYAGAISVDGIQSQGQTRGQDTRRGQSWRLRYSKTFEATGTGFTLASYQYASSGFKSLSEVLDSYRGEASDFRYQEGERDQRKSRTTLTFSQSLGALGYVSLSGSRENYWQRSQHRDELTASWGSGYRGASWSLNLTQRQRQGAASSGQRESKNEQEVSLWLSLPLDRWLGGNTRASWQTLSGSGRDTQHELGLNGDALDRRLNWDVRERMTPGSRYADRSSSLLNLTWHGAYGELKGGYGYSRSSRQMNAGVAGGIVVHRHGVTAGQPQGQTLALVAAPGAAGVSANGWPGVRTDWRGYTTLGYLSPYQENTVTLDPTTLPPDVEIPQTDSRVVPTAGAVIPAAFVTRTGGRALITLTRANGQPVPYGALVTLDGEARSRSGAGIVGDNGEVYLSGLPQKGSLLAVWGDDSRCRADYQLPADKGSAGVYSLRAECSVNASVNIERPAAATEQGETK